jgi:hypothetical protein
MTITAGTHTGTVIIPRPAVAAAIVALAATAGVSLRTAEAAAGVGSSKPLSFASSCSS